MHIQINNFYRAVPVGIALAIQAYQHFTIISLSELCQCGSHVRHCRTVSGQDYFNLVLVCKYII